MKLYGKEMIEFLKEFQDELIEEDIPLWGFCTKDVGDNERFYARCECGYESEELYDTIDEAEEHESDTCPNCGDFLDFLPESYKYDEDDNTFTKLSEYEFVFKDDEVRLFELDAEYNVIEYIDVFKSFDPVNKMYVTNIICYSNYGDDGKIGSEVVYAKTFGSKAFKKFTEIEDIKVYAECECGFKEVFDTFKEACDKYPTDKCPRCKERSLDIIYSDNDVKTASEVRNLIKEMEFNVLSLSDKIKKLEEQSNIIVDADGSVITLDAEGKPTITFEAFDETYAVKDITIDNGIVILEYDEGFEVQLLLK